ncbi:MAG: hypothetical protein WC389_15905 [Lutibacter sp.]|jgi:hypothetical protein
MKRPKLNVKECVKKINRFRKWTPAPPINLEPLGEGIPIEEMKDYLNIPVKGTGLSNAEIEKLFKKVL